MKKGLKSSILLSMTTILMVGCGGGSSSTSTPTDVTNQFVDDPVNGLDYKCSPSQMSGITKDGGYFTCKSDDEVTFSLGDYILGKSKASTTMVTPYILSPDNEEVAINIAQLLQTLNVSGDDSTIEIDDSAKELLSKVDVSIDDKEFDDKISQYLDTKLVSEDVAKGDMDNFLLKSLLAGKTLYSTIYLDIGTLESISFNEELSEANWRELIGGDESGSAKMEIRDGVIFFSDDEGNDTVTIKEITDDYILGESVGIDSGYTFSGETRLYFDKEKATDYITNYQLKELLAGKTLYTTIYDKMRTFESWSFSKDFKTAYWKELIGGDDSGSTDIKKVYRNTISLYDKEDGDIKITVTENNIDYLNLQLHIDGEDDENLRLYFDEKKAKDYFFQDSKVIEKTISDISDWDSVEALYKDTNGDCKLSSLDIVEIKMTQDDDNLYIDLKRAGLDFPSKDYYYNYWIYFEAGDDTFSVENFHDNDGNHYFRVYKGIGYDGGTQILEEVKSANTTNVNLSLKVPKSLGVIATDTPYEVSIYTHAFQSDKEDIEGEAQDDSSFDIIF